MRLLTIVGLLVLAMVGIGALRLTSADAQDKPGCEGLTNYVRQLDDAGEAFAKTLRDNNITEGRNQQTMSSDDWTAFADANLEYSRALRAITPPDWAETWHDLRIQSANVYEQIGRSVAIGGMLFYLPYEDTLTDINNQISSELSKIGHTCPDFVDYFRDETATATVIPPSASPPPSTPVALPIASPVTSPVATL